MKKIKYICIALSFASIGLQAATCDIPEPYSSLCNYKPLNVPNVVDTFGIQQGHIYNAIEKSRFPAQELLGLAMSGNTDAMEVIGIISTDKNWKDYWSSKRNKALGFSSGEHSKSELIKVYKELITKTKIEFVKQELECKIAMYEDSESRKSNTIVKYPELEKLALSGNQCAILKILNYDRYNNRKDPNFKSIFDLEKILELSDSPNVYKEAVGCFSNTNSNGDSFCGKFTSNKQAVVKYANAYAASKNKYQIGIDSDQETFSLLLETARKAVKKAIEKQDQNMIEDAIYYYQQALQIPIKDKKKLDATRYELAFILDPASKVYAKAKFGDVVELLIPNYRKINTTTKCDTSFVEYSSCRQLSNYITSTLLIDGRIQDKEDGFDFSLTYTFDNLPKNVVSDYLDNAKDFKFRNRQLSTVNLCLYDKDGEDKFVGSCKYISELKNVNYTDADKAKALAEMGNFADAIINWIKVLYEIDKESYKNYFPKYQEFRNTFVLPKEKANYYFDKLYLSYMNDNLSRLLKGTQILPKNEVDKKTEVENYTNVKLSLQDLSYAMPSIERLHKQKGKCKPMSDKYPLNAQCDMKDFFDVEYLKTLPEYKQAKEAGSIYALIADGTLKTEGTNDSKDNTYESINKIFEKMNSLKIYQVPHFGTPGMNVQQFKNVDPKKYGMDLEWLIFALDKYKIKTNLKPYYPSSKAGGLYINDLPKPYHY